MSSPGSPEDDSDYFHGYPTKYPIDPPSYSDVMRMDNLAAAPLLDEEREESTFSGIFGETKSVQFEWTASEAVCSFLIRSSDGSLQAKGVTTTHNTTVQNVNGMEMLKIVEGESSQVYDYIVHSFRVVHKQALLGNVEAAEKGDPSTSLRIHCQHDPQLIVKSLKLGDYAIFRDTLPSTPLCSIQMPGVENYTANEFNIKIIFHPRSGITEDEQLLCTAAAIAFKTTKRQPSETKEGGQWVGCCAFCCIAFIVILLVIALVALDKRGCENKKARGLPGLMC